MSDSSPINNNTHGNLRKTEGATVLIEWDIGDFKSLFEQRKSGFIARSPTFEMWGSTWKFLIRRLSAIQNRVWVYLSRQAFETNFQLISYLVVIQINGDEICGGNRRKFVFGDDYEFCSMAMETNYLLSRMTSDAVTVLCTFFPEAEEQKSEALSTALASHEGIGILSTNLRNLFLNGENCDFVINVKDKKFQVHKAILSARSPVLSAMLNHDMAEKKSGVTEVVDCEPEVFEQFLLYLYAGRVDELSWDNVTSLYTLGDKYDLEHLRKVCVAYMESHMCVDKFCDALALAAKHNVSSLVKCAVEFFSSNIEAILLSTEWQSLMKKDPVICNEILIKYVKSTKTKQDQ